MKQTVIARVSDQTFDDFLASEDMLAACEEDAIREIIADRISEAKKAIAAPALADILAFKKRKFQ